MQGRGGEPQQAGGAHKAEEIQQMDLQAKGSRESNKWTFKHKVQVQGSREPCTVGQLAVRSGKLVINSRVQLGELLMQSSKKDSRKGRISPPENRCPEKQQSQQYSEARKMQQLDYWNHGTPSLGWTSSKATAGLFCVGQNFPPSSCFTSVLIVIHCKL